jgi:hypothetical protein
MRADRSGYECAETVVTSVSDQERVPQAITDDDLIAAVRGRLIGIERAIALKELVHRKSPRAGDFLSQVVVDPTMPLELRTTAAIALAEDDVPQAEDALIAALESDEPALARRAAESLGRIGERKAYEALARRRMPSGERPSRAIEFARTLIAYRLGLDTKRLKPPAAREILEPDRQRAVEIKFDPVRPEDFRAAALPLKRALPRIAVDERGSLRFSCRRERLWVMVTSALAVPEAGKRMGERSAVAAAVLKESTCPDGWYVYEYILTHPRDERRAEVFGVRPTGELLHYGEASLDDTVALVKLQAVNSPRVLPIVVAAEYRGREGVLEIKEALAMTEPHPEQKRPTAPRPESSRQG